MSKSLETPTPANGIPAITNGANGKAKPATAEQFMEHFRRHVRYSLGKDWGALSTTNMLLAVSLAVRDLMVDRMIETERRYREAKAKRVYYLSMEFLVGRSLGNNVTNLGVVDAVRDALLELGVDFDDLREEEVDAALGNGGLGRLAACFLDSLATLDMPGFGYGINYEYGLFKQDIENGFQKERPDSWRSQTNPWMIERPDESVDIPIYGNLAHGTDRDGSTKPMWVNCRHFVGVPSDMPIVGYGANTVNFLRLYTAKASQEFDIQKFNEGNYMTAVEEKIASETVSKVLYPSDEAEKGKELRLLQEYFFVSCAIRDIVRRYLRKHATFDEFPNKVAIQLNDTHPALAVAELMRVLMDEHRISFEAAWEITTKTLGYTNHTLLPEALEKWPEALFHRVLPRHLLIVHEINRRFLEKVAQKWPEDHARLARMSIIEEGHGFKQVRMAHLALVGSHAVNGVAELHSDLVKTSLVPDFYELWPERFSNKTNGVTQRRWLLKANPGLADLISRSIGDGWITDLYGLEKLEPFAEDEGFRKEFLAVKRANKIRMAKTIKDVCGGVVVDPDSIFDVICKRIHEYKRQLLMALRVIHEYLCLVEDRKEPVAPRTYIFAGKAAPGYWAAKQIIKLANDLARIVNNDPRVRDRMKVVFVPDYRVSLAEKLIPSADLSEQISTAGKEASGTSNMKFAMNGALTMCTWDGANIEIAEAVGAENIFVFGHKTEEIKQMRETGTYNPWDLYHNNPAIKRVMDTFQSDRLFGRDSALFNWIFHSLLNQGDTYFHLADFESYLATQDKAGKEFKQPALWAKKAILNVSRMGKFSSDRTVRQYAEEIWGIKSIP
ncbi:MAG: glycogen/starch/alpha-glucan phosphorylase [Candidatus Sumerlaeaceae bacterium]|nr:glycogen/starch/alpha-glucan phosphorylase [Candidatus Sumerlaeaceae bacterium]